MSLGGNGDALSGWAEQSSGRNERGKKERKKEGEKEEAAQKRRARRTKTLPNNPLVLLCIRAKSGLRVVDTSPGSQHLHDGDRRRACVSALAHSEPYF